MRNIFPILFAIFAVVIMSCGGSQSSNQKSAYSDSTMNATHGPKIEFDTAVFNFGRILQGEQVSTVFKFKNVGDSALIIHRVETSCGCTVPEYDKSPVAPGQMGQIRVRFDSDGKEGSQYKTVKVTSNCRDNIFDLVIMGDVEVR